MSPQSRPLDVIAAEIRASKAETIGEIIAIGGLLREAKTELAHGQWLPWLQELGYAPRTAQNYMRAHKFAGRCQNLASLKLTSRVVYLLADSGRRGAGVSLYTADVIAAILAEAKDKPVDLARADAIARSLHRKSEMQPAAKSAPAAKPDSQPHQILKPSLQPKLLQRDAPHRDKFAAAIAELETLTTQPSRDFIGVISADRLEIAADFVKQVATASRRPA